MNNIPLKKPEWLKAKSNSGSINSEVYEMLRTLGLNTVCEEAACPNCGECFGRKTATFMILGRNCTRRCRFCNVSKGEPSKVDCEEPSKVAYAVNKLNLRHAVITSVTRDDLQDGGASHFAAVIKELKALKNPPVIEVLIPDFQGDYDALLKVIKAEPNIINHNIETVPRLYETVRPSAHYKRSIELIGRVSNSASDIIAKSGLMVGLGEKYDEILQVMSDLVDNGCSLLTIGQYLSPSKEHYPVQEYIEPHIFEQYKKAGEKIGFKYVASAPLVRSSYMAETMYSIFDKKTK